MVPKQWQQLIWRDRLAEQKSLIRGAALHAKKCELVTSFDSFRDDVKLQCPAHADDRSRDGGIDLAQLDIFDERPIDLERIDGKPLEIGER